MNELIFLGHILVVVGFVLGALRLGALGLTALIALLGVLANVFVVKQMTFLGFSVTCSDVFAIGGILSLNLLQEYFGKESAQKAVKISLWSLVFFALMAQIHLLYIPASHDFTHGAFLSIFSSSMRIIFASIATFFIVQQLDIRLFPLLRGSLPIRVGLSLLISQALDTVLFSLLGLYGLVASVLDIIIVSFLVKCLVILISAPFSAFSKRFVKHELSL